MLFRSVLQDVRYVPLPKSGRCRAGNAGLAQAKGELICFLDDDDLFYADHLEVLVAAWSAQPELGAVYGLAYEVRTDHAGHGYGHTHAHVWRPDGTLVAISRQTVTVFG